MSLSLLSFRIPSIANVSPHQCIADRLYISIVRTSSWSMPFSSREELSASSSGPSNSIHWSSTSNLCVSNTISLILWMVSSTSTVSVRVFPPGISTEIFIASNSRVELWTTSCSARVKVSSRIVVPSKDNLWWSTRMPFRLSILSLISSTYSSLEHSSLKVDPSQCLMFNSKDSILKSNPLSNLSFTKGVLSSNSSSESIKNIRWRLDLKVGSFSSMTFFTSAIVVVGRMVNFTFPSSGTAISTSAGSTVMTSPWERPRRRSSTDGSSSKSRPFSLILKRAPPTLNPAFLVSFFWIVSIVSSGSMTTKKLLPSGSLTSTSGERISILLPWAIFVFARGVASSSSLPSASRKKHRCRARGTPVFSSTISLISPMVCVGRIANLTFLLPMATSISFCSIVKTASRLTKSSRRRSSSRSSSLKIIRWAPGIRPTRSATRFLRSATVSSRSKWNTRDSPSGVWTLNSRGTISIFEPCLSLALFISKSPSSSFSVSRWNILWRAFGTPVSFSIWSFRSSMLLLGSMPSLTRLSPGSSTSTSFGSNVKLRVPWILSKTRSSSSIGTSSNNSLWPAGSSLNFFAIFFLKDLIVSSGVKTKVRDFPFGNIISTSGIFNSSLLPWPILLRDKGSFPSSSWSGSRKKSRCDRFGIPVDSSIRSLTSSTVINGLTGILVRSPPGSSKSTVVGSYTRTVFGPILVSGSSSSSSSSLSKAKRCPSFGMPTFFRICSLRLSTVSSGSNWKTRLFPSGVWIVTSGGFITSSSPFRILGIFEIVFVGSSSSLSIKNKRWLDLGMPVLSSITCLTSSIVWVGRIAILALSPGFLPLLLRS